MSERFVSNVDIARGILEVSVETAKRAGAGALHLVTERFQNPTASEHHFDHVTDRPATYTFPTDSEGAYMPDPVPDVSGLDIPPNKAA